MFKLLNFITLNIIPKVAAVSLMALVYAMPASATFIGQTVDFKFSETGYPDESENGVMVTDPDKELFRGDGSDIDNALIMSDGEFIDIGSNTITFSLYGGAAVYGMQDGVTYRTTGFGADATYTISGFDTDFLTLFDGPAIAMELDNILGVTMGNELIIGSNFISLNVGTLGVGEIPGAINLGTVTLRAVPVPAALPLLLSGLAVLGLVSRRRKTC